MTERLTKEEYLRKYQLELVSIETVKKRLSVTSLFESSEEDDDDNQNFYEIYFHEGDLEIIEETIPNSYALLVVNGNLKVSGSVSFPYYVTGNSEFDHLTLQYCQKTVGMETIRYVASAIAEDHEVLRTLPHRHITASIFFSWFYDLNCFSFNPETTLVALYNYDDLQAYKTNNTFLKWHEYAFVLQPDLYYTIEEDWHDGFNWDSAKVYQCLKAGKSIFADGFNPLALKHYEEGIRLMQTDDFPAAFHSFKKAFELWPGFSLAYSKAGLCLWHAKAYQQAVVYFKKAYENFPEKVKYPLLECLERGMFSAMAIEDLEAAQYFTDAALSRGKNAVALKTLAEISLQNNELPTVKAYLTESLEIRKVFTNNWLMGLVYYKEGNQKESQQYFNAAKKLNPIAAPYDTHSDLGFFYGNPVTVNWESTPVEEIVKDQNYWNDYFERHKNEFEYGIPVILKNIPIEYRTTEMLNYWLELKASNGHYSVGNIIKDFPEALLTREHIHSALNRTSPCYFQYIPSHLLADDMYALIPHIKIEDIPLSSRTYAVYLSLVKKDADFYNEVPKEMRDEQMKIATITGGLLDEKYCKTRLPKQYYQTEAIKKAIDFSPATLEKIPAEKFDKDIYEYAIEKYGETAEWQALVTLHNRDFWKMKHRDGPDNYDTFEHVWACFWDEAFIIRALTCKDEGNREKLFDLPLQYITAKVAKAAVAADGFNFIAVPQELMTPEMCEQACASSYGAAIEYTPVAMRTEKVCQIAIAAGYDNLKFVPKQYRTKELCKKALRIDTRQEPFIPYEVYVELYSDLLKTKQEDYRKADYLTKRGVGYFFENDFAKATADFLAAMKIKDADPDTTAQALYMLGWIRFKAGDIPASKDYLKQAKAVKYVQEFDFIDKYENAILPPIVYAVTDFNFAQFNEWMEEIQKDTQAENYDAAMELLNKTEQLLKDSQCSEDQYWALVWDYKRYALHEQGRTQEWQELCFTALAALSKIQLWDYLEEHKLIRAALRNFLNAVAWIKMDESNDTKGLEEALQYSKTCLKTIAAIEDKDVLYPFYETNLLILDKARKLDKKYEDAFKKAVEKIKKLHLVEDGYITTAAAGLIV